MDSDRPSAGEERRRGVERRRFERRRDPRLSPEELEALAGRRLPDREAMSVLDGSVSIPIDPAAAVDVLAADDPPDDALPDDRPPGGPPPAGG